MNVSIELFVSYPDYECEHRTLCFVFRFVAESAERLVLICGFIALVFGGARLINCMQVIELKDQTISLAINIKLVACLVRLVEWSENFYNLQFTRSFQIHFM